MYPMLRRRALAGALLAMLTGASAAWAATYHLAVDVPAHLGSVDATPTQIVRSQGTAYALEQETGIPVGALAQLPDGRWLIAPSEPAPGTGGIFYFPRDLVAVDVTGQVTLYLDGGAAGIPPGTAIDALAAGSAGEIYLSFDVPTTIMGQDFGPSDIVALVDGGFTLLWDAAGEGVPAYANLVGLDATRDSPLMTFDVPVTLAAMEALPGDLISWEGTDSWVLFNRDPSWPVDVHLRDFALPPPGGAVPDGQNGSVPLTVRPAGGGQLLLSWGVSCAPGDTDYEVYEGVIGSFPAPTPIFCSTGGLTSVLISPGAQNRFYVVVPRNSLTEGSYGTSSDGTERAPSPFACLEQTLALACQ
jgi:hypothetical protein